MLLALQRTAGNAAVARLMRVPAAPAQEQVRVVERPPTIPEPGVHYVIGRPERRYDFEVTIHAQPLHFRELTPQEVVTKLRMVWRLAHDDLDDGRKENERLVQRRKDHNVAGYWSDLLGGVDVPDPDLWNAVGRGPLAGVRTLLDSTEAELKTRWAVNEAASDRNLSPELERNPLMQAALAFDATQERIKAATALLERAASDLRECQRRLDDYVKGSTEGAARAITGIKITIVVLTAAAGGEGAEFAGEGAGIVGKAFASAGTSAFLGVSGEFFTQVGEMRIGEREHFDIAKIAKVGAKDFVTMFVGGVVGGKFSKVLQDRLGGWVYGLSEETLATYGLTRAKLLSNAERLFAEWIAGIGATPFATTAGALTDRALDGKFHAETLGDFGRQVLDDMISSGKMGGLLVYGNHALGGHAVLPVSGERPAPGEPAAPPRPAAVEEETGLTPPIPLTPTTPEPVIEESGLGGFEPPPQTPWEEPSSGPERVEIDLDTTEPVDESGLEPLTPQRETRVLPGAKRWFPTTVAELKQMVTERLREARERMEKDPPQGILASEFDKLLPDLRAVDPDFAARAEQYNAALQDADFVRDKLAQLWELARAHNRTMADELEHILGGGAPNVNEYEDLPDPDPSPDEEYEHFRQAIMDQRTLVDLEFADDVHSAHIHAFQEYLGDCLWGPGEGKEFWRELAELQGETKTRNEGMVTEHQQPFWSRLWDAMFDTSPTHVHAPEVFGRILQEVADFPIWDPDAPDQP